MFKLLKRIIYTYTMGYKDYQEEIQEFFLDFQLKYYKHLFWLFFGYSILTLITDLCYWQSFYPQTMFGLLVALVSCINWIILRFTILKRKKVMTKVSNILLFLFLQFVGISHCLASDYIGDVILVCTIVSTAMIAINPLHYFWMIVSVIITDLILYYFAISNFPMEMYYLFIDNIAMMIITMEICFLLSRMRYRQFREAMNLKRENSTDALTGLYNRKYFEWFFNHHYEEEELCAMIHLDLDNFKLCNDTFGHQAGDEVLYKTADILKGNFRQSDCVARVGGDEFMIFMKGIRQSQIVMEKVDEVLKQFPLVYGEGEKRVGVSISIGVAFSHSGDKISYEEMYLNADAAMYRAKRMGKGRAVVFGEKEGE